MIIVQTKRITIRQYLPGEEGLFLDLLSDKRLTDYLPKRTVDDNRIIFRDTLSDYQNDIKLTRWGVFTNEDGEYIGLALLKGIANEPDRSELGYVVHHKFSGQGIATEVSEALINYGFVQMKLLEIFAVTDQENIASQRVLLKAGMQPGDLYMRNGQWLSYFKISADQWL